MPPTGRFPNIDEEAVPQVPGATLAALERYAILKTLAYTGGSTTRAAEILGISPRKIQYRLLEYKNGSRREQHQQHQQSAENEC